jgi:hypothetical protein
VNTSDTITIIPLVYLFRYSIVVEFVNVDGDAPCLLILGKMGDVPNRQDTTSLGETRLFLNTTDSLFENGGNLGGSGLRIGGVGSDTVEGSWCDGSSLDQEALISRPPEKKVDLELIELQKSSNPSTCIA